MDNKQLWEKASIEIEISVSKANWSTWFKNTNISRIDDGIVYLNVPNEFVKEWLFNKFHKLILKALRGLSENIRMVEYIVVRDKTREQPQNEVQPYRVQKSGELPLSDLYIDKEDNLNPRYTFDSFIIGPFNELAHAAAQAVIKNLGVLYNPFFIYGGTGLGKTHLIQSIGNSIKKQGGGKKINYTTSEKFSLDYINSLQNNKVNGFKEKYRKYDILIMDDIQFFSNKEKTQEELFHLFNVLYENNKQIIFSSDRHPNYIPGLEDRLKSRFGAGMIVDISQPEYESRLAILKSKIKSRDFIIPDEVVEYLASIISGNIRELEGILNAVICQTELKNRNLNLDEVKALIKNSSRPKKIPSIKEVAKAVSVFYDINENTLYEKTRKKEVVKPRQILMYLLREDFNVSYPSIGQKLGGRDHSTVIHSCEKIKNDLKVDSLLNQELEQLRSMLV